MKHIKLFEQFIKESNPINELTVTDFKAETPSSKDLKAAEKWLKKYMIRTSKTTEAATNRLESFNGGKMFTHVQYHIVKPNGNKPDRPTFRLHQSQEWLNDAQLTWMSRKGEEVNATYLTIYELKAGEDWNTSQGDDYQYVGAIYVDTKAFFDELNIVFEVIKRAQ